MTSFSDDYASTYQADPPWASFLPNPIAGLPNDQWTAKAAINRFLQYRDPIHVCRLPCSIFATAMLEGGVGISTGAER